MLILMTALISVFLVLPAQAAFVRADYSAAQDKPEVLAEGEFSTQQKLTFLRSYSTFVSGQLKASRLDLEEAIKCFARQGADTEDSCQEIRKTMLVDYVSAFQEMRLYLAMAKPEKGFSNANLESFPVEKYIKRRITINLEHLFANLEIPFLKSDNVPEMESLQPLSEEEIEQAKFLLEIDTNKFDKEFKSELAPNYYRREGDTEDSHRLRTRKKQQARLVYLHQQRKESYKEYEKKYYETIQRHPLVVFMRNPEIPKAEWKNPDRPEFSKESRDFEPVVKRALEVVLSLQNDLAARVALARGNNDYDTLLPLAGLKGSVSSYLSTLNNMGPAPVEGLMTSEDQLRISSALIDEVESNEFWEDMGYIGYLVAAGAACMAGPGKLAKIPGVRWMVNKAAVTVFGRVPKFVGLVTCTIGAGLLANIFFYDLTFGRHQQTFKEIFASQGGNYVFQEIEKMEDRDLELLFESAFFFVGTGVPQVLKATKPFVKKFFNTWQLTRRADQ